MNNMVLLLLFSHSHYFGTVGIAFIVLSSVTVMGLEIAGNRVYIAQKFTLKQQPRPRTFSAEHIYSRPHCSNKGFTHNI